MKIANIEQRNSSFLLSDLRNFNEIFRKDVTYDNIKSHKKPGFHPLFSRYIYRKTTRGRGERGGQLDLPQPILGLKKGWIIALHSNIRKGTLRSLFC